MKLFALIILLAITHNCNAQNCDSLVTVRKVMLTSQEYYDMRAKQIEGRLKDGVQIKEEDYEYEETLMEGASVKYSYKPVDGMVQQSEEYYFVRERNQLYLSIAFEEGIGTKIGLYERKYTITFTDGSEFKYTEPFHSSRTGMSGYILLKGKIRQTSINPDSSWNKPLWVYGDTALFKKMMTTPIQSIKEYGRFWSTIYSKDPNKYAPRSQQWYEAKPLIIPKADAIKLMQSLQCLIKLKG